ncbi:MAG: HepT-like ribonuclease domain-containing protein [Pseudomonadota bacterium]
MRKDDLTRLRHMVEFAQGALRFAGHRSREDLDHDQMLTLALIKAIENVGEAACRLSPEFRERHPEIPWPSIMGMRHKLVHAYFEVNLDMVWDTTVNELLPLIQAVERIISTSRSSNLE